MAIPLPAFLAAYSTTVRDSTLRRLRLVHPCDWDWRQRPGLLSFADVLKHLVDADHWLLRCLDDGPPSQGVVISPGDASPAECPALLRELERLGEERRKRIAALHEEEFDRRRFDLGRRGALNLFELILRCNLDHEAHHRGALQLALRLRYG